MTVPWLEGASDIIAIYRKRMLRVIALTAALCTLVGGLIWTLSPNRKYLIGWCIGTALAIVPLLFEMRRAIIFTSSEFVFRRNSGSVVRIPIDEIVMIEETSTAYMLGARPTFVPAIRLSLNNGASQLIPIDYSERTEILNRLRGMASLRSGSKV